jgi:hypothetical protein
MSAAYNNITSPRAHIHTSKTHSAHQYRRRRGDGEQLVQVIAATVDRLACARDRTHQHRDMHQQAPTSRVERECVGHGCRQYLCASRHAHNVHTANSFTHRRVRHQQLRQREVGFLLDHEALLVDLAHGVIDRTRSTHLH